MAVETDDVLHPVLEGVFEVLPRRAGCENGLKFRQVFALPLQGCVEGRRVVGMVGAAIDVFRRGIVGLVLFARLRLQNFQLLLPFLPVFINIRSLALGDGVAQAGGARRSRYGNQTDFFQEIATILCNLFHLFHPPFLSLFPRWGSFSLSGPDKQAHVAYLGFLITVG